MGSGDGILVQSTRARVMESEGGKTMPAHIDQNGRLRMSWIYDDPKLPRSKRGICGARTRKGTPCQAPPVWNKLTDKARNGRCKLHGGLSTGPKTQHGKDMISASNKRRKVLLSQ